MDIKNFYNATDPSRALSIGKAEDRKYYIDFSSVRGGDIIQKIKRKITYWKPDDPTCDLFTGHIGCGKSTELLRLRAELEAEGFYVVYFESSEDLEMTDILDSEWDEENIVEYAEEGARKCVSEPSCKFC